MLLIPKGINGQWLDSIYWTLAAEMAFYGLVFCTLLTKKITLRHLAWGLTIYSAVFNAFSMVVLSGAIRIRNALLGCPDVPGAGRNMDVEPWLLLRAGDLAVHVREQNIDGSRMGRRGRDIPLRLLRRSTISPHFLREAIPAISDQSAFLPVLVWAAAVLLIAFAANKAGSAAGTASPEAPAYLRTLGLITYPLYLTHNIIGTAMIRVLTDAGMDASLAVWLSLAMLVLVCWFICAKIEPAIRRLVKSTISSIRARSRTATGASRSASGTAPSAAHRAK